MTRLTSDMTIKDMIIKMSGGNPGAMQFVTGCIERAAQIDPTSALGAFGPIMLADTLEIYEHRLYGLWNDICDRDFTKAIGLIRACQLGIISKLDLNEAIDKEYQHGLDVDDILDQVKVKLPDFGKVPE